MAPLGLCLAMDLQEFLAAGGVSPCNGWKKFRHEPHPMEVAEAGDRFITFRCPTCNRKIKYYETNPLNDTPPIDSTLEYEGDKE